MLTYFESLVCHPSTRLPDPVTASISVKCTCVPLWLLKGPANTAGQSHVTSRKCHLLPLPLAHSCQTCSSEHPVPGPVHRSTPALGSRSSQPRILPWLTFPSIFWPGSHPRPGVPLLSTLPLPFWVAGPREEATIRNADQLQ